MLSLSGSYRDARTGRLLDQVLPLTGAPGGRHKQITHVSCEPPVKPGSRIMTGASAGRSCTEGWEVSQAAKVPLQKQAFDSQALTSFSESKSKATVPPSGSFSRSLSYSSTGLLRSREASTVSRCLSSAQIYTLNLVPKTSAHTI